MYKKCTLLQRGYHQGAAAELKRGFEVLVPSEMCFEGMGAVAKGV